MAANVETMMYVREKPWHGLGVEVSEAPNSEDALRFAGLDWNVRQENVFNSRGGVIKGFKANVRDSDDSVLGVVGDRYKVVQNRDAFKFTDELIVMRLFGIFKPLCVEINPVCALLCPAQDDAVALLEVPVFHNVEPAVLPPDDACVHAALGGQAPYALQLKIFREHGCAVEALGGHAILWRASPTSVRRVFELQRIKIGFAVNGK